MVQECVEPLPASTNRWGNMQTIQTSYQDSCLSYHAATASAALSVQCVSLPLLLSPGSTGPGITPANIETPSDMGYEERWAGLTAFKRH